MEDKELNKIAEHFKSNEMLSQFMLEAQKRALRAKRKALRILIPAVVLGSLILIGLGIIIGKFIL